MGLLLAKVTGKRLRQYAQEKLWSKIGTESNAFFYESKNQPDASCLEPKQGRPEDGYGYACQWCAPPGRDGVFMGLGIFGQCIYINPARQGVIVQTSAWPEPVSPLLEEEQGIVLQKIASELMP